MNLLQVFILLVRRSLGVGGNAVKDPAGWSQRLPIWILRFAQNDRRGGVFTLGFLFSVISLPIFAAGEPVELAGDLGYLRVHSIVLEREAIAAALAAPRALVLDLRYPADERNAGEVLVQELGVPGPRSRLYVLVSPATPVPVVGAVAAHSTRLLTLGVKGSRPEPQIGVLQTAGDDRRAYDALTAGTSLADLVSGKVEKERFDEASLVHEFRNGLPGDRPGQTPTGQQTGTVPPPETGPAAPAGATVRPTDRVLQRAMHLHRALQVLKR